MSAGTTLSPPPVEPLPRHEVNEEEQDSEDEDREAPVELIMEVQRLIRMLREWLKVQRLFLCVSECFQCVVSVLLYKLKQAKYDCLVSVPQSGDGQRLSAGQQTVSHEYVLSSIHQLCVSQ